MPRETILSVCVRSDWDDYDVITDPTDQLGLTISLSHAVRRGSLIVRDGKRRPRLRRLAQLEQEDIEVAVGGGCRGVEGGAGRHRRCHTDRPRRRQELR